jgi:hypothetical protein
VIGRGSKIVKSITQSVELEQHAASFPPEEYLQALMKNRPGEPVFFLITNRQDTTD